MCEESTENIYETEVRGVPVRILNPNSLTPEEIQWVLKNVKKNIIKRDEEADKSISSFAGAGVQNINLTGTVNIVNRNQMSRTTGSNPTGRRNAK
jgi:hypothetical protein